MATAVIGGVRFSMEDDLVSVDDDGFADLDLDVQWFTGHPPSGTPLAAPMDLELWLDQDAGVVNLPAIDDHIEMRGWQLRQVAPTVAACFERLTLHASAVTIDGQVLAFVAESGTGKSTLAWALVKAGAEPLSDDLLPIRFTEGPIVPTTTGTQPIAAIAFLTRYGELLTIDHVDDSTALQRHIANGFGEHGEPSVWGFQFDAYHRLVSGAPHIDLTIPDDRNQLPHVTERLIDLTRTAGFTT